MSEDYWKEYMFRNAGIIAGTLFQASSGWDLCRVRLRISTAFATLYDSGKSFISDFARRRMFFRPWFDGALAYIEDRNGTIVMSSGRDKSSLFTISLPE